MTEYDILEFCADVMRSKGYDPTTNLDVGDIFMLQKDAWVDTFSRNRLGETRESRERALREFAAREFVGGPGRVLEAFKTYLSANSHKFLTGPDWQKAARERSECPYCENRGLVSSIPVVSERGLFQGVREYSFACVCDNSVRFAGVRKAEDWMLRHAVTRKGQEAERLRRWRRENDLDTDTFAQFMPRFREWMKRQEGGVRNIGRIPDLKPHEAGGPTMKRDAPPKKESQWTTKDEEALSEL